MRRCVTSPRSSLTGRGMRWSSVDSVQRWIAAEMVRQNVAGGYFELVDYGPDGEARYMMAEGGVRRVEAMLRGDAP